MFTHGHAHTYVIFLHTLYSGFYYGSFMFYSLSDCIGLLKDRNVNIISFTQTVIGLYHILRHYFFSCFATPCITTSDKQKITKVYIFFKACSVLFKNIRIFL